MTLNRLTVLIAATGMIVSTAPASAGALSIAGPIALTPHPQVEQIRYVRHRNGSAFPAALVGGIIAGVVGGAISNGCYFNDCGYDDTGGYYGGSYYSGGYSGGYVHRGYGGRGGYGGARAIGRGGAGRVGHIGGIHKR